MAGNAEPVDFERDPLAWAHGYIVHALELGEINENAGPLQDRYFSAVSAVALLSIAESLQRGAAVQPPGVWVAWYSDRSAVVLFATELEARRWASDGAMRVDFVRFGDELGR